MTTVGVFLIVAGMVLLLSAFVLAPAYYLYQMFFGERNVVSSQCYEYDHEYDHEFFKLTTRSLCDDDPWNGFWQGPNLDTLDTICDSNSIPLHVKIFSDEGVQNSVSASLPS